jgi:hypothetical protein
MYGYEKGDGLSRKFMGVRQGTMESLELIEWYMI